MRKKIHDFTISGIIGDDSKIIKAREFHEAMLLQQMRDKGYVPVLDMSPQFSLLYNNNKDQYNFSLTMYGIFVGIKKSKLIEGFSGNQFLPR